MTTQNNTYTVYLIDTFSMYSEGDTSTLSTHDTYEEAVAAAQRFIDRFISEYGTSEDELAAASLNRYESPYISPGPEAGERFNSRVYYSAARDRHFAQKGNVAD